MHAKLKNGKMLNLNYVEDIKQGFHDKTIVVVYLTNGTKFIEKFETEEEAAEEVQLARDAMESGGGLKQENSLKDFPKTGNTGTVYIAKDTGQTYYWDKATKTYITTGIAGRTGIYSYNGDLPARVGNTTTLQLSDLVEVLTPTVDYMNGSEVVGKNNVHAIIIDNNEQQVTVKTLVDLTIESFRQVENPEDLPEVGSHETLYFVRSTGKLMSYDRVQSKYIEYYNSIQVDTLIANEATARTNADNLLQAAIDQEIQDRIDAITAEANARQQVDQALQDALDQEIEDRETAITNEATTRQNADTTLQTNIDNEAATRLANDNTLQTNIDNEAATRAEDDLSIKNAINQEIQDRQTAITNEAAARDAADDLLATAIQEEAEDRQQADTTLQTNIDNEANARANADQDLQNNIDTESATRLANDTTLQTNIDNETTARTNADNVLQTNITNEANTRQTADNTLQANIDQLELDIEDTTSALEEKLDNIEADLDAVNLLLDDINGEQPPADETLDYVNNELDGI